MASLLVLLLAVIVHQSSSTLQYNQSQSNYIFQRLNTSEAFEPFQVKTWNIRTAIIRPKIYCPIVSATLVWTPEDFLCTSCIWYNTQLHFCDEFLYSFRAFQYNSSALLENITTTGTALSKLVPPTRCVLLTDYLCFISQFRDPIVWNATAFLLPQDSQVYQLGHINGYTPMFAGRQNQTQGNWLQDRLANYVYNQSTESYKITLRNYIMPMSNGNTSIINIGRNINFSKAAKCPAQKTCPTTKPVTVKECPKVTPNITTVTVKEYINNTITQQCNQTQTVMAKQQDDVKAMTQIKELQDRSNALIAVTCVLLLLLAIMIVNACIAKQKTRSKPNNHPY
uniref:Uncharacterized protein n=1 Tax=Guangdong mandarin rat snake torovirus TaxID=2116382 RepID=A0A2P1GNS2_9NIDO|nr:hypothetical protein [Guangdong mandarin rat snake torovirus]